MKKNSKNDKTTKSNAPTSNNRPKIPPSLADSTKDSTSKKSPPGSAEQKGTRTQSTSPSNRATKAVTSAEITSYSINTPSKGKDQKSGKSGKASSSSSKEPSISDLDDGSIQTFEGLYHDAKGEINQERKEQESEFDPNENVDLHKWAREGNLKKLRKAWMKGVSININEQSVPDGNTTLGIACRFNHLELVEFLVKAAGADKYIRNILGDSPLHRACAAGHLDIVKFLIERCSWEYKTDKNKKGDTALHVAALHGHKHVAEYLIEECSMGVHVRNFAGSTVIIRACCMLPTTGRKWHNHKPIGEDGLKINPKLDVISFVLESGGNVEDWNYKGDTPLHRACSEYSSLDIVKYLIEWGSANPEVFNKFYGDTPLHIACTFGHTNITKYLIEKAKVDPNITSNMTGETPLHKICKWGSVEEFKNFVQTYRTAVHVKTNIGDSLVHEACRHGKKDIVEYLVKVHQQNIDEENERNETPFWTAAVAGKLSICRYLHKELNCRTDIVDIEGSTLAHRAAFSANVSLLKYLVEEVGANVTKMNDNGERPIDIARSRKKKQIVSYILQKGKRAINAESVEGFETVGSESKMFTTKNQENIEPTLSQRSISARPKSPEVYQVGSRPVTNHNLDRPVIPGA